MNCIDYRRQYTANPNNNDAGLAMHRESCMECYEFTQRMKLFETSLSDAVNIDVPEGIESRIILHTLNYAQRQKKKRLYAIAASIFLVFSLLIAYSSITPRPISEIVLAHINEEKDHLYIRNNIKLKSINDILQPFGKHISKPIGQVNYAGVCEIHNNTGAHLVIRGKTGPVTIMIMPSQKVRKRTSFRSNEFRGIVLPISRHGSMAIVGKPDEALENIENKLLKALAIS